MVKCEDNYLKGSDLDGCLGNYLSNNPHACSSAPHQSLIFLVCLTCFPLVESDWQEAVAAVNPEILSSVWHFQKLVIFLLISRYVAGKVHVKFSVGWSWLPFAFILCVLALMVHRWVKRVFSYPLLLVWMICFSFSVLFHHPAQTGLQEHFPKAEQTCVRCCPCMAHQDLTANCQSTPFQC